MAYTRIRMVAGTTTYEVRGITTETDQEIINYCDCNAFGGYVRRYTNGTAEVQVYTD